MLFATREAVAYASEFENKLFLLRNKGDSQRKSSFYLLRETKQHDRRRAEARRPSCLLCLTVNIMEASLVNPLWFHWGISLFSDERPWTYDYGATSLHIIG